MAPVLDDLLNDSRLVRLFSKDARHCAFQLWILQIKSGQSIENRVVYGRLLPYNHSSDSWSASDDDNFQAFGENLAQIVKLNLFVKSVHCAELLRQLSAGRTISAMSEELKLGISDRLNARFGSTALAANGLVYRPVAYLLNRDSHDRRSSSSPHGSAGAFSASITRTDKEALFRLGQDYDVALTTMVVKHLNADTGLDFGRADIGRFGDFELLVFPALDDREQHLLSVSWTDAPRAFVARFNPIQVPHFSGFQFRLNIANDDQIVYSSVATAERGAEGVFECKFELGEQLDAMTDSTELDIFGFHEGDSRKGLLCCRWRVGYLREIDFQSRMAGHEGNPVKFDWLEKATRPSASARVKAALTINRSTLGFTNRIGGRGVDPWVPANRDLVSLFARLHPLTSDGRFFLRRGPSEGEGRLQFVEWFRELLEKYKQHQVVIFDPYFEAAGLGLLTLCAASEADYIVFRSLAKSTENGEVTLGESKKSTGDGIDNLIASCDNSRHLLQRIKLRIYGLKDGRLHDRYILIMGHDGLPAAGFNLSNSFQKATENHPLLVTSIPADVLLQIEPYKAGLIREAKAARAEGKTKNPSIGLLFDSATSPTVPRRYEPLRFLEKVRSGDVLGSWAGERSLRGLSGNPLKDRMTELGLIKEDSLNLTDEGGLRNCLDDQVKDFADFTPIWEVLGEVLAHSHFGDSRFRELESEHRVLQFLRRFLEAAFNRAHDEMDKEWAVMDAWFFRAPVDSLLHSSYRPQHCHHPAKYAVLNWAEYFAIKILWWYASDDLLEIAEIQMAEVPIEPQGRDVVRISLLSQIVGEISLSVLFGIDEGQRNRLVRSSNGLLQWMGLSAIEQQLEKSGGLAATLQLVAAFSYPERVRALGWMVNRAAGNPEKAEIYYGLIGALHEALPAVIPADEFRLLVDSMRGHMKKLAWAEPWLFQDVVFPLLRNGRAKSDDACEIWVQELANMLGSEPKHQPRLFDRAREGQTTNITAFLLAYSNPERQQSSLKSMRGLLKWPRRIVQQPLASTSDWTRWDDALAVAMWILIFARWSQYYLRERGIADPELEKLASDACELAMIRPMHAWRSDGPGKQGELAAVLDQVDELLASSNESKG